MTGESYYRARYYDPQTGRFLSEDPLGFGGGNEDFYGYALNDPTGITDPSGMTGAPGAAATAAAAASAAKPALQLIQGGLAGGGAAAGGAGAGVIVATVGLVGLNVGLLGWDLYEGYNLGVAYGWWKPFLDSGNMQQVHKPNRAKCQDNCPPCDPPVGSLHYRVDEVPRSSTHPPWPGTHWHVEQMHQRPAPDCTCWWVEISNGQGPVPPGVPLAQ